MKTIISASAKKQQRLYLFIVQVVLGRVGSNLVAQTEHLACVDQQHFCCGDGLKPSTS